MALKTEKQQFSDIDHVEKEDKQSHVSFLPDFPYTIFVWVANVINTAIGGKQAIYHCLTLVGSREDSRSRTKEERSEEPRRLHVGSESFQSISRFLLRVFPFTRFVKYYFPMRIYYDAIRIIYETQYALGHYSFVCIQTSSSFFYI